ncbi:LysR family transcriptional regulator [Clostridium magnum]|uniref:HTH-type transcriptional regulator GltC n=1 Tax=Clostridium magnum DSM 2767 TaxID=1121326 RepID=A0A161YIP3_9CLOT|nr:LysR family transcriptional regulator [Clostridium magnum]KZL90252.1 HTH-type transcriptional regulator GltC [Clostridium magnum DSM 2767]SHI13784.1 DNA-binding transcriptional regulator, LysR family [Clostridium magnum DSM 2767]
MELLQLKYFQTVARLEHMTRAAEELRIPQPALSKTISLLEKELGVLLFDRRGKYIHLNDYGRTFLTRVDQALGALEDGKQELNDLAGKTFGEVKLAVLAASNLLPELLASFRKEHPHINFNLIQHFPSPAARPDFDLCISSPLMKLEGTNNIPLISEEIFLAVPTEHPLAKRGSVKLNEVAGSDFISLKQGKVLREITDTFCKYAGFTPHVVFESDDPATVRGLIRAGQGIAFIPAITWGGSTGSSMVLLHIEEPICKRTISLTCKEERYLPQAARLFRQFSIDYFAKLALGDSKSSD